MENNLPLEFERLVLTITSDLAGQRIDRALATVPKIATRSQATRLLQAGRVRISGKVLKPSYLTQTGDKIDIDIPATLTNTLLPYNFPLSIPYEDEDLLIVDKPAGLVVHPACGHLQDTLVNALLHHTKDLSLGFNEQRPGLVHRIDKGTSGLLVIAKNEVAQRKLALQFQRKTSHRLYRAIVFGRLNEPQGTFRSFLSRHPLDRKRVASSPEGRSAITHYQVSATHQSGLSLLELRLETGRTHQIRVHLSEAGHPIVADEVYGGTKRTKSLKSVHLRKLIEELPRFALHAMELGITHPSTEKFMLFRAPWPKDLMPLIEHCGFPLFNAGYEISTSERSGHAETSLDEPIENIDEDEQE